MNSPASFVKSLLAQCCLGGICEWVVCPGARNMALLQVLAAAEDLVKWTHFDERSAAFFALGRIQDMGLPVAVVTTSGTAAAELLPAVVEAYYQRRPLLLLTADRPAACRGSAAPQAIEQADLFGIYAPTIDLETPESLPEDILQDWDYASPLHINVCLPDPDPAWNPGSCDLYPAEPPEENGFRGSLAELARVLRFKSRDGLVVMIGGLDPTEQAPARWLANELKAPVVADATSGLREELAHLALTDADALLREHPPAVLLRLGDVPVGRFWRDLEDIPATEVFSVTRTGFSGLARPSTVVTGNLEAILHALGDIDTVGDVNGLRSMNKRRKALMEELLITCPESEQAMVRSFSCFAADGDYVFPQNSAPDEVFRHQFPDFFRRHSARGGNTVQLKFRRFRRDKRLQTAAGSKKHVRRDRRFLRQTVGFQQSRPALRHRPDQLPGSPGEVAGSGRHGSVFSGRGPGPEIFGGDKRLCDKLRSDNFPPFIPD